MSDLTFSATAVVRGNGRDREGTLTVDGNRVRYSAPAAMGGKGAGASPESLLCSAVAACYSLTLHYYVQKRKLPLTEVEVGIEGTVAGHPQHDRYSKLVVHPTIRGGDPGREALYREAANEAREHCFIGQTVAAGGVEYQLGTVRVAI